MLAGSSAKHAIPFLSRLLNTSSARRSCPASVFESITIWRIRSSRVRGFSSGNRCSTFGRQKSAISCAEPSKVGGIRTVQRVVELAGRWEVQLGFDDQLYAHLSQGHLADAIERVSPNLLRKRLHEQPPALGYCWRKGC
jgi:hypothetical protein